MRKAIIAATLAAHLAVQDLDFVRVEFPNREEAGLIRQEVKGALF